MKTFNLTIKPGDDAMQTGFDIGEALREQAARIEDNVGEGNITPRALGSIWDSNGNRVGEWSVS